MTRRDATDVTDIDAAADAPRINDTPHIDAAPAAPYVHDVTEVRETTAT